MPRYIDEIDRLLAVDYAERRFAAVAVTFVSGDEIFVCTHGHANGAEGTAIDPVSTGFYIGSISKTFTGLAIAQLIEQGLVGSVDDPVNGYLQRAEVDDWDDQPITIRHLLTHSAGFEDRFADIGTAGRVDVPVSATEIDRLAAEQVAAPGEFTSYANYGTALLGILIEDVTGMSVRDYFLKNIWQPLGMNHTDFAMGLAHSPTVARAQNLNDGVMSERAFLAFHPLYWPVGAIYSSPSDMGRYVRAHTQQGTGLEGVPLLGPGVFGRAQDRLFGNHPGVNGFAMQITRGMRNGEPVLAHGGSWPSYNSMIMSFPQRGLGFFASIVSLHGTGNPLDIVELADRITHAIAGPLDVKLDSGWLTETLDVYAGDYLISKRNQSRSETLVGYLSPSAGVSTVTVTDDGQGLMINGKGPFLPVSSDLFANPDHDFDPRDPFAGHTHGFMRDENGNVVGFSDNRGLWSYQRVSWGSDPRLTRSTILYGGYVLMLALLAPIWNWKRRTRFDYRLNWLVASQPLLLIAMGPVLMAGHAEGGLNYVLISGDNFRFTVMALLGLCVALISLMNVQQLTATFRQAPDREFPGVEGVHRLLITLAGLAVSFGLLRLHLVYPF